MSVTLSDEVLEAMEEDLVNIPLIEVDATYQTYESDFCKLKPGTLVRLKVDFYGDPMNLDETIWNMQAGQHLLYLGIMDTSDNPRANHFIKEVNSDEFEFRTFDAMHCWLHGEKILNVNDFRPLAIIEGCMDELLPINDFRPENAKFHKEYWETNFPSALDAIEIVSEPLEEE